VEGSTLDTDPGVSQGCPGNSEEELITVKGDHSGVRG